MAIVERNVTTTRTTNVEAENDTATGILVVLGIIVALAAAYFLYDYYAAPQDSAMVSETGTVTTTTPSGDTMTTVPADETSAQ